MSWKVACSTFLVGIMCGQAAQRSDTAWPPELLETVRSGVAQRELDKLERRLSACLGASDAAVTTLETSSPAELYKDSRADLTAIATRLYQDFLPKLTQDLAFVSCNAQKTLGGPRGGDPLFREWCRGCGPFLGRLGDIEDRVRNLVCALCQPVQDAAEKSHGDPQNELEPAPEFHAGAPIRAFTEFEENQVCTEIAGIRVLIGEIRAFFEGFSDIL